LRTPKETSGALALLCHTYARLPIFAHDPAPAPPAALDVDQQASLQPNSKSQVPFNFVFAVLRCVLVIDLTTAAAVPVCVSSSCTQPPNLALPDFHQHSQQSASARIKASRPRFAAFFPSHALSIHPFFSAGQSKSSDRCSCARKPA